MELETINKLYLELSQIATAKTAREIRLEEIITAIECNGCFSGDCPHDTKNECYMELLKIPSMIADIKKEHGN